VSSTDCDSWTETPENLLAFGRGDVAMGWWRRVWSSAARLSLRNPSRRVRLTLPGWNEDAPDDDLRIWRDPEGDVLSLASGRSSYPLGSDEMEQRRWCRKLAQSRGGGLIEVQAMPGGMGPSATLIYKRLQCPAYVYTGMFITSAQGVSLIWTIVACERGVTGVREAVVTATLMEAGTLTRDGYKRWWAQDPYDPAYQGVDRSVLRFMSDDECYDQQFPKHPLSKVRRVLSELPGNMQFDSQGP